MKGDIRSIDKAREVFSNAKFIHQLYDGRFQTDLGIVGYHTARSLDSEIEFIGKLRNSEGDVIADMYRYKGVQPC